MNAHLLRAAALAALVLAGLPSRAAAQTSATWPTELTQRPLTLRQDMLEIWVPLQSNFSSDLVGEPIFLNPSITYGLTDQWSVGLRHFLGVCLRDEEAGCPQVYNDVSVETVYALGAQGPVNMAARLALNWAPIDPSTWSAEVGALARGNLGPVTVLLAPALNFGLSDRDQPGKVTGTPISLGSYSVLIPTFSVDNREYLLLPATVQVQVTPMLAAVGAIAANGPLNPEAGGYGDFYEVPVSLGAVWTPVRTLDVGAHFTWNDLAGANGDADRRIAGLFATLRR
jgi:hypothetical protein